MHPQPGFSRRCPYHHQTGAGTPSQTTPSHVVVIRTPGPTICSPLAIRTASRIPIDLAACGPLAARRRVFDPEQPHLMSTP